jgi:uncharacterized protein
MKRSSKSASDGSSQRSAPTEFFIRASNEDDRGHLRSAFRLFLAGARSGDVNAQARVGYCYDVGRGVRRDLAKAMYWYKRAYRRGDAVSAFNMGTIWRDRGKTHLAQAWFEKAIRGGHHDGHLDIARLYIEVKPDPKKAKTRLNQALRSDRVTASDKAEAAHLLERVLRLQTRQRQ